jgi:NAD(P)-dependent dehydrogenase (short-subunit alcohol dehydrogenase family)
MNDVAVVTGASQGLGLALAHRLIDDGWAVVIDARHPERLRAAEAELASAAPDATERIIAIEGDITDAIHRHELARSARRLGNVRLVVNNASTLGASPLPPLLELDPDVLRATFEVNVVAPLALVRALATDLGPGAVVVNITSDAAAEAYPTWGGYGSTKAALEHAGAVLAVERPDWRVYSVDPGDMRTEMHQQAFPGEDISDRPEPAASVPGLMALIGSGRPSGRYVAKDVS